MVPELYCPIVVGSKLTRFQIYANVLRGISCQTRNENLGWSASSGGCIHMEGSCKCQIWYGNHSACV